MNAPFPRRTFLGGMGFAAALVTGLGGIPHGAAMGRKPIQGRVSLHVPWPVGGIDPHDLGDAAAALFGEAIADPVFAFDSAFVPYPALAASLPTREAGETVVRLREGLLTARGLPLDAHDLIASIERARSRGAPAMLAEIPRPKLRRGDPLSATFGTTEPMRVARALASPVVALLPRSFKPTAPDGTGAFRADVGASGIVLSRNPNGARGPSFLEQIEVGAAEDLKTSLRAFEAAEDDIGWLGLGLHAPRALAQRFDLGRVGWVVLIVGPDAGPNGTPGDAQRLVDAIPSVRLAHLGLGPLPAPVGDPSWKGPPSELLVDSASPFLVEVAQAIGPVLNSPGHEVTVTRVPRAEVLRRRARSRSTLSIEFVRPLGPTSLQALLALATIEDPTQGRELALSLPHPKPGTVARNLTGALRVGVIGEVHIAGGAVPDLVLARAMTGEGWDLGASFRRSPKPFLPPPPHPRT